MVNENNNSHSKIIVEASPVTLNFNCPVMLELRVGLPALRQSISQDLLSSVLHYQSQAAAGLDAPTIARAILQRSGFVAQAGQDFGVTSTVNDWLSDASGNFLVDAVRRAHRRTGIDDAQQIVWNWRESNRRENGTRAAAKTDEILAELDKVKSLGSHLQVLTELIGEMNSLSQLIESNTIDLSNRIQDLETRLQAAQSNVPNVSPSPLPPQALRWNDLRGHFNKARNRLFGSSQSTIIPQTAPRSRANVLLERELLSSLMSVAALEAEQALIAELNALFEDERRADDDAILLFTEAEAEASREARRMEGHRPYGLAGGELILNNADLTATVIKKLFGTEDTDDQNENLAKLVLSRFAESQKSIEALNIIVSRQTAEISTTVSELFEICSQLMEEKMLHFTIADALAALLQSGVEDWQNKLTTAFRNTITPSFLATNYDKILDLQTFAIVVYAPSKLSETDEFVRNSLTKIKQDIGLSFDIKSDDSTKDRLLFYCEYFCVPLDALRFYEENRTGFDAVKTQPRFNPHSLIRESDLGDFEE